MTAEDLDARLATVASLAEPVRRALYRHVVAQAQPVSRDGAAQALGVARHVAKFHLDRLVEDGLLEVEYRRPPGRGGPGAGRPAKLYRPSNRQIAVTLPERNYELAGRILARAVHDAGKGDVPVGDALAGAATDAGKAVGEEARGRAGARPSGQKLLAAATEALRDCGYEPRVGPHGVTLANCPFQTLAREYTETVCGMNLAFVRGVLDAAKLGKVEAVLDPAPNQCCVRLVQHR
ncbi:MAG TPA: helix-turn-helix domain-containing protein [Acidimicrobiales bacterium]|nr:helix-turn-helix domain-containing protein [Acidimicrobiales bacterium]